MVHLIFSLLVATLVFIPSTAFPLPVSRAAGQLDSGSEPRLDTRDSSFVLHPQFLPRNLQESEPAIFSRSSTNSTDPTFGYPRTLPWAVTTFGDLEPFTPGQEGRVPFRPEVTNVLLFDNTYMQNQQRAYGNTPGPHPIAEANYDLLYHCTKLSWDPRIPRATSHLCGSTFDEKWHREIGEAIAAQLPAKLIQIAFAHFHLQEAIEYTDLQTNHRRLTVRGRAIIASRLTGVGAPRPLMQALSSLDLDDGQHGEIAKFIEANNNAEIMHLLEKVYKKQSPGSSSH